jgi:hypothetical protein
MWRSRIKPGTIYRPASRIAGVLRRGHKQDLSGFLAIHPCLCLAPRPRPSRQDLTAHGLVGAAPGLSKPKAPACNRSRGSLTRLWHLLSTLHERRCRSHARLASGWRAAPFSGRVSNPLDHYRRFLVTFPSSFSGLCLTLAQFDCKKTAYGIIMSCGGRQVVHCADFHQRLSYAPVEREPNW